MAVPKVGALRHPIPVRGVKLQALLVKCPATALSLGSLDLTCVRQQDTGKHTQAEGTVNANTGVGGARPGLSEGRGGLIKMVECLVTLHFGSMTSSM